MRFVPSPHVERWEKGIMEIAYFLAAMLGGLLDPIRWIVCAICGWFLRPLILAMAVSAIGLAILSIALNRAAYSSPSGFAIFAGIVGSCLITWLFAWIRRRREKTAKEKAAVSQQEEEVTRRS